ncbi:probable 39S ribosomal protein L49, mitochondrial [Anopheles arabiensis]|uniref:Large ribosomal subunit protein mL49 n=3 Tax=gambiae species complex TaxID=44542 RepID=Q7PQY2_ANOGA|nr:probable 39S ribosomal protein L49, mitochondrial [Anopheles arabiensis]XP_040225569.2 probable 39S ribosomal protein L49, mitochondrial [Anopheles coluzzii]XP_312214.4 large ribosomal subunit protein mL49 [Anopheles gambiae]EAA08128.5 AGAP002713-PA [Anopheles gambiae str. PEST]
MALRMVCSKTFSLNRIISLHSINHHLPKPVQNVTAASVRWSSFRSSEPVGDLAQYPEVEVVRNPPEWKYVERLLAPRTVPKPTAKDAYPSGWKPANPQPGLKYVVQRTKNHMLPVYLRRSFRGQRRITAVRHVEGDIWLLEAELRYHIERQLNRPIITRVNEMSGQIELKGDHVAFVEKFLLEKGM